MSLFSSSRERRLWMWTLIVVAVMGVFMSFLLDLWIVQWVIRYGGMIMVVSGVIMAGIGLIGMFKSDDDKRIEKLVEKQLKSMKRS